MLKHPLHLLFFLASHVLNCASGATEGGEGPQGGGRSWRLTVPHFFMSELTQILYWRQTLIGSYSEINISYLLPLNFCDPYQILALHPPLWKVMPTYTCTMAAQSLELLCTCILERLWCLIKGQSWIIYQGFGGNIPHKNTPYWGMIDKIFQHFWFWIELYSYSNVFFCLSWKTCSIDHVRGNLCIHIWQQKPRITITFKCCN